MAEKQRVLLPTNVRPTVYHIHLTPNLESNTFDGTVDVELQVNQDSNFISFNALEIKVSKATLTKADGSHERPKTIAFDEPEETYKLEFESGFTKGTQLKLALEFTGELNDRMVGFYRSKYDFNGEEKKLATTQFEPVEARRAFPCWDEPAIKAKFVVKLTVPKQLTALSNMPPVDEKLDETTKTVTFAETPVMSTYILAFVVGDFEYLEEKTKEGIIMRVYTPLGKKDKGKFALDIGVKVLSYFADYFNIPYPLIKQDMIAIPDFAAGAMENWGLITYREGALLCDEANASVSTKSRIAQTVAHELAHQWFGNLVTMEWWKDLWLNEGFATYIGNKAVDVFFREWQVWPQFIARDFVSALSLDSLLSSHPIEVEIYRSREIDEIFDEISYSKGASAIRMLATYLGEADFQKGLQLYLNRHKYANARTEDLWKALGEVSGKPISEMMNTWTKEVGYPILKIEKEGSKLVATQSRYLSTGRPTPEQDTTVWPIKLPINSESTPEVKFLDINERSVTLNLDPVYSNGWLKANAGQSAFLRVHYSAQLYTELEKAIRNLSLSSADRLGMINDAFALAKSGALPLSQALSLTEAFSNEVDYNVWLDITTNLADILALFESEEYHPLLKKFCAKIYRATATKLGWDPRETDSDLDKLLRAMIISRLADTGDEAVVKEGKARFSQYFTNKNVITSDLRAATFKIGMRNGGREEYEQLKTVYEKAEVPEEKLGALVALGLSKDPEIIKDYLVYGFESGKVRNQDLLYVVVGPGSTPQGREITWNYVKQSWQTLKTRLQGGMSMLGHIIHRSCGGFNTEEAAAEVEAFFNNPANQVEGTERTIKQTLESIRADASWLNRERESVRQWVTSLQL